MYTLRNLGAESRKVPSELLCICWLRHAAAEVPDFGIRARTVCNAGDPVGRLPSFPDGDFGASTRLSPSSGRSTRSGHASIHAVHFAPAPCSSTAS